jgi:hypothetical protein
MPTLERLDLSETLGPLLVAEIENYLRTITPAHHTLDLQQLLTQAAALPPRNLHGRNTAPWHHPHTLPQPSRIDRWRSRRPIADITPTQHLHLMSAYIRHHGWTQGALWNADGAVCILGAQLAVTTAGFGTPHVAAAARQRIGNALGRAGHPMRIDDWNDQPSTSETDVHHLLRTAAA